MNEAAAKPPCLHQRFGVDSEVNRYCDSPDEPAKAFSVEARVKCLDCGRVFVVDNEATIPGHPAPGAYLSPDGRTLEVPIKPDDAN